MSLPASPVLVTKLQPPRRVRGVIARPRLNLLLDQITSHLLTVVKSTSGSGKTTAALAWSDALLARGTQVAWLSLDQDDDDPGSFMIYLAAALNCARGNVARWSADFLGKPSQLSGKQLSAVLINELASRPDEIVLFIDDYHWITNEEIHAFITQLLRNAPEHFHMVLMGRSEPPLALAPYRLRDDLFEVDNSMLRFDVDETVSLVRKAGHEELSTEDISLLQTMTGGWVAALRAVMLSLRDRRDFRNLLGQLSGVSRSISGLFADPVGRLPSDLFDFVLQISILERVCGTLAEAVTGSASGQSMLEDIERRQLFLIPLDGDGIWFSFHPLFREFLLKRLREERGDAAVAELHRRAANWFSVRNLWVDVVRHRLAAGDSDQALLWMDQCAMRMVETGNVLTLLSWERQLHSHVLESPLRLRLAVLWGVTLARSLDMAEPLLDHMEAELSGLSGQDVDAMRVECRAVRALLFAFKDDAETASRIAAECIESGLCSRWAVDALTELIRLGHLYACRWDALYAMQETPGSGQASGGHLFSALYKQWTMGRAEFLQGRAALADLDFEEALRIDREVNPGPGLTTAISGCYLAQLRYEQNRLEEAFRLNNQYRDTVMLAGPFSAAMASFRVSLAEARHHGDARRMHCLLDEINALARSRGWLRFEALVLLERIRICLDGRRRAEMLVSLQRIKAILREAKEQPSFAWIDIAHYAAIADGWIQVEERAYPEAIALLEKELEVCRGFGLAISGIGVMALLAHACLRAGQSERATTLFLAACSQAADAGVLRPLIDHPFAVEPLCELLEGKAAGSLKPFIQRIAAAEKLNGRKAESGAPRTDYVPGLQSPEMALLSPRECQILKLLTEGQTNKEIARALAIAPETVKSHLKTIFGKLNVGTRAQAAAVAQTLNVR